MSAEETVQNPAVTQEQNEENEGAKVFIGNLAYAVKEEDVRGFLAPAGGELVNVELPMRGPRPAGFAFAFYKTEEQAKAAVEKLNGQELSERKLTLDIAKPASQKREELKVKRKAANEKRKAAKAAERAEQGETEAAAAPADGEAAAEGAEKPKKKRAPRKKTPRRRQAGEEDGEDAAEDAAAPAAEGETAAPARKTRQRKPRTESARIDDETAEGAEPKAARAPKKRMLPTGEASKTSIFVANLPFSIDDEGLAGLFDELNIKVKSAHVVYARKFPKSTTRRSKGFGFVEVEDAEKQHEAVEKLDGKMLGERALTVKIANELKEVEQAAAAAEGATEATA